jgi:hypothetical protein
MKVSRWMPLLILALVLTGLPMVAGTGAPAQAQTGEGPGMIVFASDRTGNYEIFLLDPETGLTTQLTNEPAADIEPVWSPDGNYIAFTSDRDGDFEVYVMRANGSDVRQLTNNNAEERQPRWQPDGLFIVFVSDVNGQWDLYTVSADGAIVRQLTNDLFDERGPGFAEGGIAPGPGVASPTPIVASPVPSVPEAVVKSRQLNVRTNPGEGAQIVTSVPQETALDIIGRRFDNTWLQVRIPGRVGVHGPGSGQYRSDDCADCRRALHRAAADRDSFTDPYSCDPHADPGNDIVWRGQDQHRVWGMCDADLVRGRHQSRLLPGRGRDRRWFAAGVPDRDDHLQAHRDFDG